VFPIACILIFAMGNGFWRVNVIGASGSCVPRVRIAGVFFSRFESWDGKARGGADHVRGFDWNV
jgi:hypothetical protein